MRFVNRYKQARYTVRATRWQHFGPGQKEKIEGLHCQFADSMFDTETHGWTDAEREEVEAYLMAHEDFGVVLQRSDDPTLVAATEVGNTAVSQCLFYTKTDEGVQVCGQRLEADDDLYCAKHTAMFDAPPAKPNRRKSADVSA